MNLKKLIKEDKKNRKWYEIDSKEDLKEAEKMFK